VSIILSLKVFVFRYEEQMVGRYPKLLALPAKDLGPTVEFLLEKVGVSKAELGKVLCHYAFD
jgi:hypothetical protein